MKKRLKTFRDLEFKLRRFPHLGYIAVLDFPNGHSIHVYYSGGGLFDIDILLRHMHECPTNEIYYDVKAGNVSDIMINIQKLK